MQEQEAQNQINIELDEETAMGIYANLAIITHSNTEFVSDFIRIMPGMPKAKVLSRIIFTPEHAKRYMMALMENIQKFEALHGIIEVNDGPDMAPIPMNFGGPTAKA